MTRQPKRYAGLLGRGDAEALATTPDTELCRMRYPPFRGFGERVRRSRAAQLPTQPGRGTYMSRAPVGVVRRADRADWGRRPRPQSVSTPLLRPHGLLAPARFSFTSDEQPRIR